MLPVMGRTEAELNDEQRALLKIFRNSKAEYVLADLIAKDNAWAESYAEAASDGKYTTVLGYGVNGTPKLFLEVRDGETSLLIANMEYSARDDEQLKDLEYALFEWGVDEEIFDD